MGLSGYENTTGFLTLSYPGRESGGCLPFAKVVEDFANVEVHQQLCKSWGAMSDLWVAAGPLVSVSGIGEQLVELQAPLRGR